MVVDVFGVEPEVVHAVVVVLVVVVVVVLMVVGCRGSPFIELVF